MISAVLNPSRCILLTLLCWCLAASSWPALGGVVSGLYDAKVEVSEQTQQAQKRAARAALSQVLVKVSGTREVLDNKDIAVKLRLASDYMRAYRFDFQLNTLYFLASFDPQKIDQLIKTAGFPIWDSRRPDTLLWLAIEDNNNLKRSLLAEGTHTQLTSVAANTADSRGIKISFPLMDLDDLQRINIYDVWGRFAHNIELASQRYQPDIVLSARMYQQKVATGDTTENLPLPWLADWLLIHKGATESGQIQAETPDSLTSQLIELLATNLAAKFAIDNRSLYANTTKLDIRVSNITDLTAYVQVSRFLASLSLVTKITLVNQQGSLATFSLEIRGKQSDLINALLLDETLKPKLDHFGMPGADLEFVWNP
jgi:hypothetical protein